MVTRARSATGAVTPSVGLTARPLPWLVDPLRRALTHTRGHALLLRGPQGVGQLSMAFSLAQAWLCESPAETRPDGLACGACPACHLVEERTHPDLRVIVPEALRVEVGLDAEESPSGEDGKRKPSKEIRVEQVRTALEFAALTASRGGMKVMVIHPAETLNAVAANALLKTLEEPPGDMRFVLSCGAADQLLPTIRSRCQDLTLSAPEPAQALAWLSAQGVGETSALLDASGRQPVHALSLAALGLDGAVWKAFPGVVTGQPLPVANAWTVPLLVDALLKLCHDSLCVSVGAPPRYFTEGSVPTAPVERLTAWAAELRKASARADHPWNLGLAVEAHLQRARDVFASAEGGPSRRAPVRTGGGR